MKCRIRQYDKRWYPQIKYALWFRWRGLKKESLIETATMGFSGQCKHFATEDEAVEALKDFCGAKGRVIHVDLVKR